MADQVLSANFVKVKYGLTLSTEGEGTVAEELISSGRVDYNSGSLVRLTATPAVGYSFTGWSGDITSISNPVEVDITSAKSITAVFDLIVVSLQVDIQGLKYGLGTVGMPVGISDEDKTYCTTRAIESILFLGVEILES